MMNVAVNQQYVTADPFGGPGGYASTGAPGSAVAGPETSAGPVVGTVTVTPVYGSSQVPQPSAVVQAGDTCTMSTDSPVPAAGDPMSGLSLADVTQTGAGRGSLGARNPNAPGVPDPAAQVAAARR
jgi:hypothetical protein